MLVDIERRKSICGVFLSICIYIKIYNYHQLTVFCLFFTRTNVIELKIDGDIQVPCTENSVYVYDGLPKFVSASGNHQSHVLGVFCSQDNQNPVTVQAKSGKRFISFD